jgi:outer membrane biosynthesis protein TonB
MQQPKRKHRLTHEQQLGIAVGVSLLLHLLLVLFYLVPWRVLLPVGLLATAEPPKKQLNRVPEKEQRMEFELVQTPEDALQPKNLVETRYASDKNAQARDLYQRNDLPIGNAFADGNFDVSEYSRGSLQPPMPPQPPIQQQNPETENRESQKSPREENQEKFKKTNPYLEQFSPANEDDRRTAFLNQFQASTDRRPVRQDKPFREQRETRSQNFGGFSLNTYNWNWAPYLLEMQEKIDRNLFPPAAFTRLGVISGETLLRFRVFADGHVEAIEVLGYEGHRALMETSVNSIKVSDPFTPLPGDFPRDKKYLEVTAKFLYLIPR